MAVSVTEHAMGGQLLGTSDRGSYYAVAKADGGWDVYHIFPDGTVELGSFQDAAVGLGLPGNYFDAPTQEAGYTEGTGGTGGTAPTGPTAAQIAEANANHTKNLRDIEQAYQNGLITWQDRQNALEESRSSLSTQKDQGLQSNSAYFSAVSPDAFQSQMGNYNQKVLDAYQKGQNTLANDEASIANYKQALEGQRAENLASENTFNPANYDTTGSFYSSNYALSPVINAPELTRFDTGIAKLGAGQVPSWAPNYGGLSTMQAKTEANDPYAYLKR